MYREVIGEGSSEKSDYVYIYFEFPNKCIVQILGSVLSSEGDA